jgi:hypothetical protein
VIQQKEEGRRKKEEAIKVRDSAVETTSGQTFVPLAGD